TVTCPTSGVCVLTWDNSFVWRRSKTVTYRADVVLPFHMVLCAENEADFVAWRAALATCLYFERWNHQPGPHHDVTTVVLSSDEDNSDECDDDECDDECDDDELRPPSPPDQNNRPESSRGEGFVSTQEEAHHAANAINKAETTWIENGQLLALPLLTRPTTKLDVIGFVALNGAMAGVVLVPSMVLWTVLVVINTVVLCRLVALSS
ncbi:hypothetical protein DYB35_010548, partial [Aphanomyces astaci]